MINKEFSISKAKKEVACSESQCHYACRTEQTYLYWLSHYGDCIGRVHLAWKAADTARTFLAELAVRRNVAASTQNQAFSA